MVLRYDIVIVMQNDENDLQNINKLGEIIAYTGGTVKFKVVLNTKDYIMKQLMTICDANFADIILIIAREEVSDVTYDSVSRVILKVIPDNEIAILVSNLGQRLTNMDKKTLCGIRNKTIIIKLPKSYKEIITILKAEINTFEAINFELHVINNSALDTTCFNDISIKDLINIRLSQKNFYINKASAVNVETALKIIKEVISSSSNEIELEIININNAYDRVLCNDVYSKCDVPPFRSAEKSGYAISECDLNHIGNTLKVMKRSTLESLEPGTCVWVNNDEIVPDETVTIVRVKDIQIIKNSKHVENNYIETEEIKIINQPEEGANIKPAGCDIQMNTLILNKFKRIGTVEMGLLASCGHEEIKVIKDILIGIMSIGCKLEEPGTLLRENYVYDSNRVTLIALLKNDGYNTLDFGITEYNVIIMIRKIKKALKKVDVLVTMGKSNEYDLLKYILLIYFKATIHFGKIIMKPGKSTIFATCMFENRVKYFLCTSGNPTTVPIITHVILFYMLNNLRCNYTKAIQIPTCLKSEVNLHPRPKFVWTNLEWNVNDKFAKAYNSTKPNQHMLNYQKSNALLMLPSMSTAPVLLAAFVPALYTGKI